MTYTIIISLLIEKPFYLLRPRSFSFQIVSELIDTFVKSSDFMSRGGAFDSLFCPEGKVFVHSDCSGGRVFASFKSSGGLSRGGWFWMKLIPALNDIIKCPYEWHIDPTGWSEYQKIKLSDILKSVCMPGKVNNGFNSMLTCSRLLCTQQFVPWLYKIKSFAIFIPQPQSPFYEQLQQ